MNLLFSLFVIICAASVQCRYPYEDSYTTGDIVPHGVNSRYPYSREGGYIRKQRGRGGEGGGYYGMNSRRNTGYGRQRDYRRRSRDNDYYLPPRGIGGFNQHYDRPDYEYERRRKPTIDRPPHYFNEDEINYGGYVKYPRRGRY